MERKGFKRSRAVPLLIAACTSFTFGCNRMADSDTNYLKAINKYYTDHPSCLFREPVKFPIEQTTSSAREIAGFNALVDQDLLTRTPGQPTVLAVAGKPVNTYDLSAKGHSEWVADSKDPGYGNLCYGHRKAVAIQSSTPTSSSAGATTTVVYRYTMKDVPDWAKAQGVTTVFHDLQADLSGHQVGRASLQDTTKGWQVTTAPWAHIDDSDIYR
ncbi:MAG: hypothetical protein NVSMB62_23010 [Acidobacteriaceae bacterium]